LKGPPELNDADGHKRETESGRSSQVTTSGVIAPAAACSGRPANRGRNGMIQRHRYLLIGAMIIAALYLPLQAQGVTRAEGDHSEQCCTTNTALASQVSISHEIMAEIDRILPRRKPGDGLPARTLKDINAPNVVTFDDGESIEIDGIRCEQDGVDNLKKIAGFPGTDLVIEYSGRNGNSHPLAHIWARESLLADSKPATGYSSPTETALTSGWCVPVPMQDEELAQRYLLLHTDFKVRQEDHEDSRRAPSSAGAKD
jgi:hypothetical protein